MGNCCSISHSMRTMRNGSLNITLQINGTVFYVTPGSLAFSVSLFLSGAAVAVVLLQIRRYTTLCGQGELGGPACTKYLCMVIMFALWIAYVALSTMEAYCIISGF